MKKIYLTIIALMSLSFAFSQDLIFTGIIDGSMSGGLPKGIELFVVNDIADLSIYGLDKINGGAGTSGSTDWDFPADAATAGDYIWITSDSLSFHTFFGFAANYRVGGFNANGDDMYELYENGTVVDAFGVLNVDGNGEPWEYLDGWAYRLDGTGTDATFVLANWSFSGPNALDGENSNATAAIPFPIGTYTYSTVPTSPTVFFKTDSFTFSEGDGSVHLDSLLINPALVSPSTESFDVYYGSATTATAGADFTLSSIIALPANIPLNFITNFTAQTIDGTIVDDGIYEGTEYVEIILRNGNGINIGADSILFVTILDNDLAPSPIIELTPTTMSIPENGGSFTIAVNNIGSTGTLADSVKLQLIVGDNADVDGYMTQNIVFDGVSTVNVTFNITDDNDVEGDEVLTFALVDPASGVMINSDSILTLTIIDNDFPEYSIDLLRGNDSDAIADSVGVKCWTTGIVLGENLSSDGSEFTIYDTNRGLGVYIPSSSSDFGYTVTEGDSVKLLGIVAHFNRFSQMNNLDTIILLGTGSIPAATVVTDTLGEYTESELITIENASYVSGDWGDNKNIIISANGIEYKMRIDGETGVGSLTQPTGLFNVTGIGSQYNNSTSDLFKGYQFKPRRPSDVVALPTFSLNNEAGSIGEDIGTVTVGFTVSNFSGNYTIDIAYTGGTGTVDDIDNFVNLTSVAITDGAGSFDIAVTDDEEIEGNETFEFTFSNASNDLTLNNDMFTLTVQDNDDVSIEEINVNALNIYPNPTSDELNVEMISNEFQIAVVSIQDVLGRTVQTETFMLYRGDNSIVLNVENMTKGSYFLNIETENGNHSESIIIK